MVLLFVEVLQLLLMEEGDEKGGAHGAARNSTWESATRLWRAFIIQAT